MLNLVAILIDHITTATRLLSLVIQADRFLTRTPVMLFLVQNYLMK